MAPQPGPLTPSRQGDAIEPSRAVDALGSALVPGEGGGADDVLRPEQVCSWREAGYALVDGVLPDTLIERARRDALAHFPTPGSEAAAKITDFGRGLVFPSQSAAVNEIALHPRLLRAMAQLLGVAVADLRLAQAELWPKYGRPPEGTRDESRDGGDNDDQRIHVDYPNHTLVHPPRWDDPQAVEGILYLSDAAECGGETRVVPREPGADGSDPAYPWPIVASPGIGALPWINDRARAEAMLEERDPEAARFRREHLYPRERPARYRPGSLLLYRHDTWHRGTPLRPGRLRLAMNLSFRRRDAEWVNVLHPGWAWGMYRPGQPLERLVATASVEQRCVLGFPAPGDPYWNVETLAAVSRRYAAFGFDPEPYRVGRAARLAHSD